MKRKQPFTIEEFKTIYSQVPRLCVDLIVQTDQGVVLTLRQKNGYINQWHLPGGTVFYREGIPNAVIRLAQEELGIEVEIIGLAGYIDFPSEEKERGFGYSVSLVFICKPLSTDFKVDDQVSKVSFFKILPDNTVAEQKAIIEKVMENK